MTRCQAANHEIEDAEPAAVRDHVICRDDYNGLGCAEVRVQDMMDEARER